MFQEDTNEAKGKKYWLSTFPHFKPNSIVWPDPSTACFVRDTGNTDKTCFDSVCQVKHRSGPMDDAKNQPELVVVEKVSELPFDALDDTKAVLHLGKMFLVRESIAGPVDARGAIFHELVGHFGLRGFFGDGLNAALDRIHVNNPLEPLYESCRVSFSRRLS